MKVKKLAIRKLKNAQAFTPVLVVGLLITIGAVVYNASSHAATAGFTFASSSNAYKIGESFDVAVYEDSGTDCANVVKADFTYPTNLLRLDSISSTGTKFDSKIDTQPSNGKVSLVQYTSRKECGTGGSATSGVSGKQLISTVTFTVVANGNATLDYVGTPLAISATDNETNVANNGNGASFILTAAPIVDPIPATPPPPPPAEDEKPVKTRAVTSVTPDKTGTPIALLDNDVVDLNTPAIVQPLPIQPDGVNRIEYYLNGDLVATVKTAPYTYHLDTTQYLNGTYALTSKTYYANGQTKSTTQTVNIHNPFGLTQAKLWSKKFAWLIILVLIVIIASVVAWIVHRRNGGPTNYYGDGSGGGYIEPSEASPVEVSPTPPTGSTPQASEPEVYRPTQSTIR